MSAGKIGVLVSSRGRGSNFGAMLQAQQSGALSAPVGLLVATDELHGALERARRFSVPIFLLPPSRCASGEEWEARVCQSLREHEISVVALAGFLRRVGPQLLGEYAGRIANVHPALLPSFGGAGMYGMRVHEAVLAHGCRVSGCTVHLVDERYDNGPIIAQQCVPVEDDDTPQTLAARVQEAENQLYPPCLDWLARGQLKIQGRRVRRLR